VIGGQVAGAHKMMRRVVVCITLSPFVTMAL